MSEKKDTEELRASLPALNFPPCRFRMDRRADGTPVVWDALRASWLVLTPEEWVRQHLLRFLVEGLRVPPALISQECRVCLGGAGQRADVVVYRRDGTPLLVAECKAPYAGAGRAALEQAVRYNSVLGARYVMVTDGMKHYLCEASPDGGYAPLPGFPELDF